MPVPCVCWHLSGRHELRWPNDIRGGLVVTSTEYGGVNRVLDPGYDVLVSGGELLNCPRPAAIGSLARRGFPCFLGHGRQLDHNGCTRRA